MQITIDLLANHPQLIEAVARCCNAEWPWYYSNGSIDAALNYHSRTATRCGVPCALVALEGQSLLGTIAILEEDMDVRGHLSPWLGCLYVFPQFRGKGIASALIEAGVSLAKKQQIGTLYAWTEVLNAALAERGWSFVERLRYQGRDVEIFCVNP